MKTTLKERVVNIHKLKVLTERAKEIMENDLTEDSIAELKEVLSNIDDFKPNIEPVGMSVNKFNSLNIDLDEWKFEINGEKINRCVSLTFTILNHCAIASIETSEIDESDTPYSMVSVYESSIKPRR